MAKTKKRTTAKRSDRTDFATFMQERAEIKREYFFMLPLLFAVFGLMMLGGSFASQSPIVSFVSNQDESAYHLVRENGEAQSFGAESLDIPASDNEATVIDIERSSVDGYWVLYSDGRVEALDGAIYQGAVDGVASAAPVDLIAHH